MSIRIVTDSSADLPPEIAEKWGIKVVPCNVVIDDTAYKDGVDITADEFYQKMASSTRLPTTTQPSVADLQTTYQNLLGEGHQIISVHVSGKLSGTVNAASQAKGGLEVPESIEVVDSHSASLALGLIAISAAQRAREARSLGHLAALIRSDVSLTQCILILDTLEYLQKGGRIGKAQAFVGSVLSVKPILKLQEGEVHPVERPRNMDRAVRRLAELAREFAPVSQLGVIYSTQPEQAATLKEMLDDLLPSEEIIISRFGATLATYVGPGAVGVALTQRA